MSKRKSPVANGLKHRPDLTRLMPVCVLLSVSLWLLSDTVSAESPYRVAPKIAPHSRNGIQQPAAQSSATGETTPGSVKTASPVMDESLSASKILPVSYQGASAKSGTHVQSAPTTAPPVKATVTKTAIQPSEPKKSQTTSARAVVKRPAEPVQAQAAPLPERQVNLSAQKTSPQPDVMDPAMDDMTPPALMKQPKPVSPMASLVVKPQPQAVIKAEKPEQKVASAKVHPAKTPEKKAEHPAKPVKTAKGKKEHPVVIAPEPLLAGPDVFGATAESHVSPSPAVKRNAQATVPTSVQPAKAASTAKTASSSPMKPAVSSSWTSSQTVTSRSASGNHAWEPGFFPVGYTPAVRPVTPEKMQALGTALTHYNRGVYYTQRKQWDAAVSEYQQVIREDINMADAYVGLSTASMYQRDWENALKNSVKALRLKSGFIDPANITQARYNLSSVYCVADDYHQAMRYFKLVKKEHHPETETLWSFLQSNCQPSHQRREF
jgi:hypothetical protein